MPQRPHQPAAPPDIWEVVQAGREGTDEGPEVSVVVEGKLADVVALVADQGGVLIVDAALTDKPANLSIDGTVGDVARVLARIYGVDAEGFERGRWYVGGKKMDNRGVGLLRVPSHESGQWGDLIKALGSDACTVTLLPDVVLVRDDAAALRRIGDAVKAATAPVPCYGVEVVLVRGATSYLRDIGISGTVGAVVDVVGGLSVDHSASVAGALRLAGRANGSRSSSLSVTSVELSVVEGRSVDYHLGDEVNVRTRAVSDQGTVTDVGVQSYKTGTDITLRVRRAGGGHVEVAMEPRLSSVREFRDGVPTLSEQRLKSDLVVSVGSVVVAAVFSGAVDGDSNDSVAGVLDIGARRTSERQDVVVLVRVLGARTDDSGRPAEAVSPMG